MIRRARLIVVLLAILLPFACASPSTPVSAVSAAMPPIDVYFSPRGGATETVVRELGKAKQEILVQACSFTSAPIAKALEEAHKRGVNVTIVLGESQRSEKYSSADFVNNTGTPPTSMPSMPSHTTRL